MIRLCSLFFSVLFLSACGNDSNEHVKGEAAKKEPANLAASIQAGKALFSANCKVCHSLDKNTPSGMAPVLENVKLNWPDQHVLGRYIKNAPEMMQENERSRKVYQEWKGKAQMPPFTGLNNREIEDITLYLYKNT